MPDDEVMEITQEELMSIGRNIPHKEKSTIISSNHIVHFTDSFEKLQLILKTGFRPSFSSESPIYQKEFDELKVMRELFEEDIQEIENIDIPMCCFCDIPLKNSKNHRKIYGKYGIALNKKWAINNLISPLIYTTENTRIHTILFTLNKLVERENIEENRENAGIIQMSEYINKLFKYVKPYYNFAEHRKYYDEREWRYIPDNFTRDDLQNTERYLKFESTDLTQVIVTKSKEKRIIAKLINKKYGIKTKKLIKIRNH